MDPAGVRRFVDGHLVAARRCRHLESGRPVPPAESFARALRMAALARALHGWPPPASDYDVREERRAWSVWARLRRRLLAT